MIQNLGNRMEEIQDTFNKDQEELKSKQTMMNNKINEIDKPLARLIKKKRERTQINKDRKSTRLNSSH